MKPRKLCNKAGCKVLVDYNEKYCSKHKKQSTKNIYQERKSYDGKYLSFYHSQAWKKLSKNYRLKHSVCEQCLKNGIIREAQQVDHIIPIRDDWSKRLNTNNLQSLCVSCHSIKTRQEQISRNTP